MLHTAAVLKIMVGHQTFSNQKWHLYEHFWFWLDKISRQKVILEILYNHSSVKESSVLSTVQYLGMLILTAFAFKGSSRMLHTYCLNKLHKCLIKITFCSDNTSLHNYFTAYFKHCSVQLYTIYLLCTCRDGL